MRIATTLLLSWLVFPLVLTACGDDKTDGNGDAEPYDTLQACYVDHHEVESLPVGQAIVVCCIDHPIAGVHPSCGATATECVSHVRAALDSSITDTEISAACADYQTKL